MKTTTKLMIATGVVAAAISLGISTVWAYGDAPWCAVIPLGAGEVVWQCEYYSVEECVPNVIAGNRGFCNVNPYRRGSYVPRAALHY